MIAKRVAVQEKDAMTRTAAALALVLILAGCGRKHERHGISGDEVLVQVEATGRSDTRPDEARFSAGVESRAPTAAEASTANAAKMNAVVAALKGLGVADADLQTRTLTLERVDYGPERGRFVANNIVEVRVRKVDTVGRAVAAATGNGANVLSGPDFRVADPEAASRSAYAAAYRAARARADAYAGAAGLKVARVLAIRDGNVAAPIDYGDMAMERAVRAPQIAAPPPVSAGTNTSEVTVHVDFALDD